MGDFSGDELDDRLCLALYRASHAMTAAYRQVLEPFGLTYPQYTVLCALGRSPAVTVKALGELLDADYGTMSPLVQRLEAKRLVRRARGSADERQVLVHLTEEGRRLRERTDGVQLEIGRAHGMSGPATTQLVEDLQQLTGQLREFVRTGADRQGATSSRPA